MERKKAFPDYKKNMSKKSKIWKFSKGVHDFCQKLSIFPYFLYRENSSAKCVWKYSRNKKGFPDYKNNKLKKSKIWDFSKGVSPWLWLTFLFYLERYSTLFLALF